LTAIYPALMAVINNIAAYLENLSASASSKILQLFSSMSSPSFLLANDSNHDLLHSLLESMNAIIEHQYISKLRFCKPPPPPVFPSPAQEDLDLNMVTIISSLASWQGLSYSVWIGITITRSGFQSRSELLLHQSLRFRLLLWYSCNANK
jgi:hypothetical protein